jgi:malonate decarboxylase beta subunit
MNAYEPVLDSWYEATARQRIDGLVDAHSFEEFVGPREREISPHLALFDLPEQFDDGIVVGRARLHGAPILIAAQEGRFMGGAIGEVHGAKLTGLLRAARDMKSVPVFILFDTGGVRLQEANAGELAVAEIMRALLEARLAGVPVLGLVGGRAGCFGGGGLIAGCCAALAVSEQGRIAVSGPEVIETNRGVEEFDARDRALVWRTMGGKHRRLLGSVQVFVDDGIAAFRAAARTLLAHARPLTLQGLQAGQQQLDRRLERFGDAPDAEEVWRRIGVVEPESIPDLDTAPFVELVDRLEGVRYDAR